MVLRQVRTRSLTASVPPSGKTFASALRSVCNHGSGLSKRPASGMPGPDDEGHDSQRQSAQAEEYDVPIRRCEDKNPSDESDQRRDRIKPDTEGTLHFGSAFSEQDDGENLADELNQDSGRD